MMSLNILTKKSCQSILVSCNPARYIQLFKISTFYNRYSQNSENLDAAVETEDSSNVSLFEKNKSRLTEEDYRRYHDLPPPALTSIELDVTSVRELRSKYGEHGAASGIEERWLWPSKQELQYMREYEQVKYPLSLPEMMAKAKQTRADSIEFTYKRQKEMKANFNKLEGWKQTVRDNLAKKENEAREAREKREKLIEEVRLLFGKRIDPKDDKFQEALAKKELEEKKAEKALRKQQKQQRMLEQLKKISDAQREDNEAAKRETVKEDQAASPTNSAQ